MHQVVYCSSVHEDASIGGKPAKDMPIAIVRFFRVDWHYSGGRASVLHLGDADSRQRVLNAIHELRAPFEAGGGTILSIGGPALFRSRFQDAPEDE